MGTLTRTITDSGNAPSAVSVTVTGLSTTSVQVSWTAASGGAQGVKNYKLYFGTSAGSLSLVDTFSRATREWVISSGLTAGTTYYARVDAIDGAAQTTASAVASGATTSGSTSDPTTLPRLQSSHVTYAGSFRVPSNDDPAASPGAWLGDGRSFAYGGYCFTPKGDGTFYLGKHQSMAPMQVGRIRPPSVLNGGYATTVASGVTVPAYSGASLANPDRMYGALVHNNRLIMTVYNYYDGGGTATKGFLAAPLDLSSFTAMAGAQGTIARNVAHYAGYMTPIPTEWRTLLGGAALCGNGSLSIITRTNSGPGLYSFNPDNVGVVDPVPVTTLAEFWSNAPNASQEFGNPPKVLQSDGSYYQLANAYYTRATSMVGAFFPSGTRTVGFLMRHGISDLYYKDGASPCLNDASGYGARPYVLRMHLIDVNDLLAVKNGTKNAWDVLSYTYFDIQSAVPDYGCYWVERGVLCYDDTARQLYFWYITNDPRVYVWNIATP